MSAPRERARALTTQTPPRTSTTLALLLRDQGQLAAARPLCERTLAIYEPMLGPIPPRGRSPSGGKLDTLVAELG